MTSGRQTVRPGFGPRAFSITFFILRIALGGLMFEAGLTKLLGGFSAAGFLSNSQGPFSDFFTGLVQYLDVINVLVPWGEVLIGTALILGALVRFASFWGAVEVLTFYLAYIPPQRGWINEQIIYAVVFITFMFAGTGYFLGLDFFGRRLEERRHPLRLFLG